MRTLTESTVVTRDGVVSDPHMWGSPYRHTGHHDYCAALVARVSRLVLGRETFEGFAEVWPTIPTPREPRR